MPFSSRMQYRAWPLWKTGFNCGGAKPYPVLLIDQCLEVFKPDRAPSCYLLVDSNIVGNLMLATVRNQKVKAGVTTKTSDKLTVICKQPSFQPTNLLPVRLRTALFRCKTIDNSLKFKKHILRVTVMPS